MAYGKKRRFSKKSSRKGSRKFRRSNKSKSVKVRIAKVERVLRKQKPELKHRWFIAASTGAATKTIDNYPIPSASSGAFFGPNDGIWALAKGTDENQRVGGSLSMSNCLARFRFFNAETTATWDAPLISRRVRMVVIQFRTTNLLSGSQLIPYTDVEGSRLHSMIDPERKESKDFAILHDKVYVVGKNEVMITPSTGLVSTIQRQLNDYISVSLKPRYPLIWDDDASATLPQNPIYVYFYSDHEGILHAGTGAAISVRLESLRHMWRDNS